jgi:hypothetical protein
MRKLTVVLFILGLTMASSTAFSEEMLDYGAMWKAWGREAQHAYLWGFIDGGSAVMLNAMEEMISSAKQGPTAPKNCGVILDNTGKKLRLFLMNIS